MIKWRPPENKLRPPDKIFSIRGTIRPVSSEGSIAPTHTVTRDKVGFFLEQRVLSSMLTPGTM